MNANLVVCIPVMIAHVLIALTQKEATAVSANLAIRVMDGHANYLVSTYDGIFNYSSIFEILFTLDDHTCDTICDHHCDHQRTESR